MINLKKMPKKVKREVKKEPRVNNKKNKLPKMT